MAPPLLVHASARKASGSSAAPVSAGSASGPQAWQPALAALGSAPFKAGRDSRGDHLEPPANWISFSAGYKRPWAKRARDGNPSGSGSREMCWHGFIPTVATAAARCVGPSIASTRSPQCDVMGKAWLSRLRTKQGRRVGLQLASTALT